MINFSLSQIAQIVGGELVGADCDVTSVVSDSRVATEGSLFAAIVGERVDGHDLVDDARSRGAVAALTTAPVTEPYILLEPSGTELDAVITALGAIAGAHRKTLKDVTVIGVTGSSGKTTTKDLIGHVLRMHGSTQAPAGSPNNELGLPMAILTAEPDTEFYVLEMGMRGIGHLEYLCDIAAPTIGVLTNIGHAHVGELGSLEAVAQAKAELIQSLPACGTAILNADDPLVRGVADLTQAHVVTYGLHEHADIRATDLRLQASGSYEFTLHAGTDSVAVTLHMLGEHNVSNALAAAAVGLACGMNVAQIAQAVGTAKPESKWRMEVHTLKSGVTIINDAYNANPESMAAALKTLASIETEGRRWAILGAMHELGENSVAEHDAIGRLAVRLNIDQVVVVGEKAKVLHLGATQEGSWDQESVWFNDFSAAQDYIIKEVASTDVLLFKASRSEGFDVLAQNVSQAINALNL